MILSVSPSSSRCRTVAGMVRPVNLRAAPRHRDFCASERVRSDGRSQRFVGGPPQLDQSDASRRRPAMPAE